MSSSLTFFREGICPRGEYEMERRECVERACVYRRGCWLEGKEGLEGPTNQQLSLSLFPFQLIARDYGKAEKPRNNKWQNRLSRENKKEWRKSFSGRFPGGWKEKSSEVTENESKEYGGMFDGKKEKGRKDEGREIGSQSKSEFTFFFP